MTELQRMETLKSNKIKKIEAMKLNPVVINNHTNEEEKITGLVEFINPEKDLACCFDARYYSLNACIVEDGALHCSTRSIGGVLYGAYPDSEQLAKYNESQLFENSKIKCLYRPDGTIVYPTVKAEADEEAELEMSPFASYFYNLVKEERGL